jgi:GNAT superfamily N-acetyltransferase
MPRQEKFPLSEKGDGKSESIKIEKLVSVESTELKEEKKPNIENIGKRKSKFGDYYLNDIERLIIGEEIPDTERKTFPNSEITSNWESGSIGFLDFVYKGNNITVGEMGVEPEHQKKGYGEEFIKELEKIAKERKVEEIEFCAVSNDIMVKLLEKHGYSSTRGGIRPANFVKKIESNRF